MASKTWRLSKVGAAIALALGALAWPSVVSQTVWIRAWSGQDIWVPLALNGGSSPPIAGLTGQLNYDARLLSNPRVAVGPGAQGFIAAGQLIEPGKYRFALYANPMRDLGQPQTVLYLGFLVNPTQSKGVNTEMTYSFSTAGSSGAAAIPDVSFAPIHIVLNPNSAQEWERYK